jgi:hypothetical protein
MSGGSIASVMPLSNNNDGMAVSQLSVGNGWPDVSVLSHSLTVHATRSERPHLERFRQATKTGQSVFHGHLEIPGLPLVPEQDFTVTFAEESVTVENHPTDAWPHIRIAYEPDPSSPDLVRPTGMVLQSADNTADGWLLYTRVILSLAKAGEFYICGEISGEGFRERVWFEFDLSTVEQQTATSMAKLSRKLKFIERKFRTSFLLPDRISPDEMQVVEMLFRGINEGEFTLRNETCRLTDVFAAELNWSELPYDLPGPFSYRMGPTLEIFGHKLPVGPITVRLERAALTNPRTVDEIKRGTSGERTVRFEVLDNQITYRFENYASQPRNQRMQRLNRFKYELSRNEGDELVELIDEPLQNDVSSKEASQIAVGWTQYNDLPDRYCPQVPELDTAAGQWHVPIYLVYSNGEGGRVGEVVIDEKTGVIVSHTPVDELRSKGRALAEQILHG